MLGFAGGVGMDREQTTGKQAMNVRLSAEARRLLDVLSKRDGISRAAVLELAVREYARGKGLAVEGAE
jgi:hypothetical protein